MQGGQGAGAHARPAKLHCCEYTHEVECCLCCHGACIDRPALCGLAWHMRPAWLMPHSTAAQPPFGIQGRQHSKWHAQQASQGTTMHVLHTMMSWHCPLPDKCPMWRLVVLQGCMTQRPQKTPLSRTSWCFASWQCTMRSSRPAGTGQRSWARQQACWGLLSRRRMPRTSGAARTSFQP